MAALNKMGARKNTQNTAVEMKSYTEPFDSPELNQKYKQNVVKLVQAQASDPLGKAREATTAYAAAVQAAVREKAPDPLQAGENYLSKIMNKMTTEAGLIGKTYSEMMDYARGLGYRSNQEKADAFSLAGNMSESTRYGILSGDTTSYNVGKEIDTLTRWRQDNQDKIEDYLYVYDNPMEIKRYFDEFRESELPEYQQEAFNALMKETGYGYDLNMTDDMFLEASKQKANYLREAGKYQVSDEADMAIDYIRRNTMEGAQEWAQDEPDNQEAKDNLWFMERKTKYEAIQNPELYADKIDMQNTDQDYRYINNIDGARNDVYLGRNLNPFMRANNELQYMEKDEIGRYNYLWETEGKESADEYLEYLRYSLNERANEDVEKTMIEGAQKNAGMAVLESLGSIGGSLGRGLNYLEVLFQGNDKPKDYNKGSSFYGVASDASRKGVMDRVNWKVNILGEERDLFDFLYGTLMSGADSMAAGALGPALGAFILGSGAAESTMMDIESRGGSDGQAILGGAAAGVFEYLFEKVSLGNLWKGATNVNYEGFKTALKDIGREMGVNFSEEFFTEAANIAFDSILNGDVSNLQLKLDYYESLGFSPEEAKKQAAKDITFQLMEAGFGGMLMGGTFGAVEAAGSAVNTNKATKEAGQNIVKAGTKAQLKKIAVAFGEDTEAGKLAKTYNAETATDKETGKLFRAVINELPAQVQDESPEAYNARLEMTEIVADEVEQKLNELGEENSRDVAVAVTKLWEDMELTGEEMQALAGSMHGIEVEEELFGMHEKTQMQTAQQEQTAKTEDQTAQEVMKPAEKGEQQEQKAEEKAPEINVPKVKVDEDGKITIRENETEVDLEDSSLSEDEKTMIRESQDMAPESAAAMRQEFKNVTDISAHDFTMGFKRAVEAYKAGKEPAGIYAKMLSESSLKEARAAAAKENGQLQQETQQTTQEMAEEMGVKALTPNIGNEAGAVLWSVKDKNNINAFAQAQIKLVDKLAKAMGVQVRLFDTIQSPSGGKANATYEEGTNIINLAINSEAGLLTKALSHEGYHYIREWNQEGADKLKALVTGFLDMKDGYSLKDRIQEKIAEYRRGGIELDEDAALEEITADGLLDYIGTEANFAQIAKEDKNLAIKIKEWISQAAEHIRNLIGTLTNQEAQALRNDLEYLEARDKMMAGVLKKTAENVKLAQQGLFGSAKTDIAVQEYQQEIGNAMNTQEKQTALNGLVSVMLSRTQQQYLNAHPDADLNALTEKMKNALLQYGQGKTTVTAALEQEGFFAPKQGSHTMRVMSFIGQQAAALEQGTTAEERKEKSNENAGVQKLQGAEVKYRLATWTEEEQKTVRNNLLESGFEKKVVDKWMRDVNGVANYIAQNKDRLDYEASEDVFIKPNSDFYRWSADASTLCEKRRIYQGTYNAIQHALPMTPLLSDDVILIRNMLADHGYKSPCGVCYVESRRRLLGRFSEKWLDTYQGKYIPTLDEVTTTDGLQELKKTHPETYKDYIDAMNRKGVMNPKVVRLRTEYNKDIRLLGKKEREYLNRIGGLRVFSFSDFETPNLIDMMQMMMDLASEKMKAQGYTKVPAFADVFGKTGMKINLSLIAKGTGFDENGNLAFDGVEGMPIEEAMRLRELYPNNVGTIIVGATREHIIAAWADDRIDMVIPFHRSGWGKRQIEQLGIKGYEDATKEQNEYRLDTGKKVSKNIEIEEYWLEELSGKENAKRYLDLCAERGLKPKFASFLDKKNGRWYLKEDGRTDGYWKSLVDYKMYDNQGNPAPQEIVKADFNMEAAYKILEEYKEGEETPDVLPVAQDVVDEFVRKKTSKNIKFSLSEESAPNVMDDAELYAQSQSDKDMKAALMLVKRLHDSATKGAGYLTQEEKPAIQRGDWQKRLAEIKDRLLNETGSSYSGNALLKRLDTLFSSMDEQDQDVGDLLMYAREIGKDLLQESPGMLEEMGTEMKEALRILKNNRYYLTEDMKSEIRETYGSVKAYMQKNFGKLGIRAMAKPGQSGARMSLAEIWGELSQIMPGTFAADATEADMPLIVDAFMEQAGTRNYSGAYGKNAERYATDIGLQLILDYYDLPGALKKRGEMLEEYRGKVNEIRQSYRQKYEDRMATEAERRANREEKQGMLNEISRNVKYINTRLVNESDTRHVPEALKGAAMRFMQSFLNDTSVFDKENLTKLREAYGKMRETSVNEDSYAAWAYDEDIMHMLERLENTIGEMRLASLTKQELEDVHDIVGNLKKMVVEGNEITINGRKETMDHAGTVLLMDLTKRKDLKHETIVNAMTRNITPFYFFKNLGGKFKEAFDGMRSAQEKWTDTMYSARKYLNEKMDAHKVNDWLYGGENLIFTTARGDKIELTKGQAMSLYATWQRETRNKAQNANHLRMGGFIYTEKDKKKIKTEGVDVTRPHALTGADMEQISRWLGAEGIGFVNDMVQYLSNDMAKLGNEVSMQLYGYRKFTEGYYFPYSSSQDYLTVDVTKPMATDEKTLKSWGAAKKLTEKANNPIVINDFLEAWSKHVNQMATYASFTVPMETMNRLYNFKSSVTEDETPRSVKMEFKRAYGQSAEEYIRDLMRDIAGGVRPDERSGQLVNKLISLHKKNAVVASASVAIQQPSAIMRAMALVNPRYFVGAPKNPMESWKELTKYSGAARVKDMGRFDTGMGRSAVEWLTENVRDETAWERISKQADKLTGFAPEIMDKMTWGTLWEAVKREQKAMGVDITTEEGLKKCAQRFDVVADATQVYDSPLVKSGLMRSRSAIDKMVTAFMSEPTVSFNLLADAIRHKGDQTYEGRVTIKRAAAAYTVSVLFNAMLKSLITAGREDDEEKTIVEKYMGELTENFLNDYNPLNLIPLVRDAVSIFTGYDVERADMSIIADLQYSVKTLLNENKDAYAKAETGLGGIAALFGVPLKNILRDGRTAFNIFVRSRPLDETDPAAIRYSMLEALPELDGIFDLYDDSKKAYYQRMAEAAADGNETEYDNLERYMTTRKGTKEETVKTEVTSEMKEMHMAGEVDDKTAMEFLEDKAGKSEDDAFWTVDKWKGGSDYKKYQEFEEAVRSGKNLKETIRKYTGHGTTEKTLAGEITSLFKQEYISLYKTNKTAFANLQARLLTAYEAIGYDRAEKKKHMEKWLKE